MDNETKLSSSAAVPDSVRTAFAATRETLGLQCRRIEDVPQATNQLTEKTISQLRHKAARCRSVEKRKNLGEVLSYVLSNLTDAQFNKQAMKYFRSTLRLARQEPMRTALGSIDVEAMMIGYAKKGSVLSLTTRQYELESALVIMRQARATTPAPDMALMADLVCQAPRETEYNVTRTKDASDVYAQTYALQKMALRVLSVARDIWPETATPKIQAQLRAFADKDAEPSVKEMIDAYAPPRDQEERRQPTARELYRQRFTGPRYVVVPVARAEALSHPVDQAEARSQAAFEANRLRRAAQHGKENRADAAQTPTYG